MEMDGPSMALEESVKLDKTNECVYEDTDDSCRGLG